MWGICGKTKYPDSKSLVLFLLVASSSLNIIQAYTDLKTLTLTLLGLFSITQRKDSSQWIDPNHTDGLNDGKWVRAFVII